MATVTNAYHNVTIPQTYEAVESPSSPTSWAEKTGKEKNFQKRKFLPLIGHWSTPLSLTLIQSRPPMHICICVHKHTHTKCSTGMNSIKKKRGLAGAGKSFLFPEFCSNSSHISTPSFLSAASSPSL